MTDVDKLLCSLSSIARPDTQSRIDVRARVMHTVSFQSQPALLDLMPLMFSGAAVACATATVIVLLPTWQIMSEPWISYFP